MINKKIIISTVILCICCLFGFYAFAENNNFVTMANGGGTVNLNTTTLGQAIVFAQKTDRYIAKSGYASILMSSKSDDITFTDETEKKTFETNVVPIQITVTTSRGVIDQIAYKVGNGANPDFEKITSVEYEGFVKSSSVTFKKNIDFTDGKPVNQFRLWAQYKDGDYTDSSYIIITVNTQGTTSDVTLESPDPLTKLASTDPTIRTSKFSIDLSTVTVCLYEGNSTSGKKLYEVSASSTSDVYKIFDKGNSCVSYLNSNVMKACDYSSQDSVLKSNKEYTIEFKFSNEEVYQPFTMTFKALSGGVADILTYPSPFNPKKEKIKIRYLLAKDSRVTIKLYDKAGKIVSKLIQSEPRSAGTNEEEWDGRNYAGETLATGAYIVEINANGDRRYTALAIVGK